MDNNINMNKSYETDCRSPLKELYIKNNTPEEKCENQNKETHLFDMESTFLENSVMIPAELNQNSEYRKSFSTNQENLTPKYSVLNSFDPIRKEGEEVISKRHNNDLLSDNVLDYSISENVESLNADQPFPNTTLEDFVENTIEIPVSVQDNLSLCTSELNGTSASNISTHSDNSVLNNTVILNKSLIVENKTPGQISVDDNSNLSLTTTDDTELKKEQHNSEHILNETSTDSLNLSSKLNPDTPVLVHLSNEQTLIPAEETFERDQNKSDSDSLNLSSTLNPNTSSVINSNLEQNLNTSQETEVQDQYNSDHILNENSNDLLNVSSTSQLNTSTLINLNKEHIRPADEALVTDHNYKNNDVYYSDHRSVIEEQITVSSTVESALPLLNVNDSFISAFSNKLVLSPNVNKSEENTSFNENKINKNVVEESEIHKQEITSNFEDKCESILQLPILSNEVILEESVKSLQIIDDCTEKQIDISLDTHSVDSNVTISTEQKVFAEINKNISSDVNNSNLLVNETSNEIIKEEDNKKCLQNKIESYEVTNTSPQTTEIEQQKESNGKLSKEKSHSIELLSSTCGTISVNSELKEIASSVLVPEGTHMSSIEPNLPSSEPTVDSKVSFETSATCTTNEMGEIINKNECFEKESDISSSAVDDNAECEKYKMQVNELKKELKSCRQKTCTLETELVDYKRKENELNMLLEDYKQSDSTEQLKRLKTSEEALKNEIKELRTLLNQQETYLKDLQQKDTKEQNEQLKRLQINEELLKNEVKELKALIKQHETQSQSEIQISRVMEEYEKSISNLISENEKMKKERDTAQMHLANIEMAFSDVHQKYERCKAIVQGYKDNEESFKQDIAMNRETIVIQEQKYETLKAHAMAQLEKSNQELAAMKKQHETEMARLTAQLKRYEIKNMSLMESLQQKAKECEQLSAVCDEFIGNV